MKSYAVLNALPADAFLNPETFRTDWPVENDPKRREEKYQEGLAESHACRTIFINASGTWSAERLNGGQVSAYEGIGYHALTSELLRGFLDGPAEVMVYRKDGKHKTIKPSGR